MSLSKQIYLYSIDTACFYESDEEYRHKRLSMLYRAKKAKDIPQWRVKAINRLVKKEKERLTALLDARLKLPECRVLNPDTLLDKNIITLFESSLTRLLGIKTNELTKDIMVLTVYFFQVFEELVKKGFYYNGEKYIFLTASAGQIRTKKAVFIKESRYKEIQGALMCGLTVDDINAAGGINSN